MPQQQTQGEKIAQVSRRKSVPTRAEKGQHTGDIFYLAKNAADRVWRVEAIVALGRMKYFVGDADSVADQRGAMRLVREWSDDPNQDVVTRQAAKAARDLTIEQYRGIH